MKTSVPAVNQLLSQQKYIEAIFELSKLIATDSKTTLNQVSEYYSTIQAIIRSKLVTPEIASDEKLVKSSFRKWMKQFQAMDTSTPNFAAVEICILSLFLDTNFPHESVEDIETHVVKRIEALMDKSSSVANDNVLALCYLLLSNAFLSMDDVAVEDDDEDDEDDGDEDSDEMAHKKQKLDLKKKSKSKGDDDDDEKTEEEAIDDDDDGDDEEEEDVDDDEEFEMKVGGGGEGANDENTENQSMFSDEATATVTLSTHQDKADRMLDTGIAKYPKFSLLYRNKASLYNITGLNNEIALENILKAKEICEEPSLYYTEGMIRQDLNMHKEAIELFKKCLEHEPDDAHTYYNIGQSYENLSETEKAMEYYAKTIHLKSDHSGAYLARARLHAIDGKVDLALADYKKALEVDEDNAEILFERAIMYRDVVKDHKLALADFEAALEMDPDNKDVQLGHLSQERLMMCNEEIAETEGKDWHAYFARGQLYLELMAKPSLALEDLKHSLTLPGGDKQAIVHLTMGYASIELGEFEDAKNHFRQVLTLDKSEGQVYVKKAEAALAEIETVMKSVEEQEAQDQEE